MFRVVGGLHQFFYAVQLSEVAAGPSSTARQRQAIADYLHAFAFFFSQEFILGRCTLVDLQIVHGSSACALSPCLVLPCVEELCKKVGNSPDLESAVRLVLESQGVTTPLLLQHVYDDNTVSQSVSHTTTPFNQVSRL